MNTRNTTERRPFEFGALKFAVRGRGVFVGGPKLKAKVEALTGEQIAEANREAWKLKRSMGRLLDRYANASIPGNQTNYDTAYDDYSVADFVCKVTWQRMRGAA